MKPNDENQVRKIKDAGPWCWQDKRTLQMIRDYMEDRHGHSAFALSTYVALTEFASDAKSETFTASINAIARRAGASYRTTWEILDRLEALGVIHVQHNTVEGTKGHAPSTYTMLCTPGISLCKREAKCLPRSSKNQKNQKKDDDTRTHARTRETAAAQSANGQSSSSVLVLSLEEAEKHPLWPQYVRFCESKQGSPTLKGFNTWLQKQLQPKRSRAKRDRIINQLNEEKVKIMRTFPDGRLAQWAKEELATINRKLSKL